MRNFNFKSFVCGVIITSILFMGIGVFAVSNYSSINVILNAVKFTVNNKPFTSDSFCLNGYNYIPIGKFCEATGLKAEYDGNNKIVNINTMLSADVESTPTPSPTPTVTPSPTESTTVLIPTKLKMEDIEKVSTYDDDSYLNNLCEGGYIVKYNGDLYVFLRYINKFFSIVDGGNGSWYFDYYIEIDGKLQKIRQKVVEDDLLWIINDPNNTTPGISHMTHIKYDIVKNYMIR